VAATPRNVVLEVGHLSVDFALPAGNLRAVDDVSMEIVAGEVYALVGESGCGKSTLANALLNLVPEPGKIVAGDVALHGRSLRAMSAEELRRVRAQEIAIVFQSAMSSFNPVVPIGRQAAHVLDSHPEAWPRRSDGVAYFEHLLELVRLPVGRVNGAFESQLSGGMKQRVAMAFACMLRPSVLILDEPTTALDVVSQRLLIEVLQDLRDELDITIVFVTHDLSVVAELATKVGVMYAGRMVQMAPTEGVFYGRRRHPYVQALLSSIPNVLVAGQNARSIPGEVPRLDNLPLGCRFAPRCVFSETICKSQDPALIDDGVGNQVACHPLNRGELGLGDRIETVGGAASRRVGQDGQVGRGRLVMSPGSPLVELRGVTHWFRTQAMPVLDGVEVVIGDGEIVAVVGESGCGKSTLGRIVCGMIRPSEGEMRFRDKSVSCMRRAERNGFRREVQMVHQDPFASLNPGLRLRTILGYGVRHHKIVARRDVDNFLLDVLHRVGLDASREFLDRYPHQLSGGQRQRVAMARAFSLNPGLIVADEAVSMLDVSMRVSLLDLMLGFHADHGMAFVLISHDMGVVRYFASEGRMLVMFYGVIVEEGFTEEVITAPSHPYTASLLQSIPVPDPRRAKARLKGEAASQFKVRSVDAQSAPLRETGCVFRARCPLAQDRCAEAPPLISVGGTHRSACWFNENVSALSTSILPGAASQMAGAPPLGVKGGGAVDSGEAGSIDSVSRPFKEGST